MNVSDAVHQQAGRPRGAGLLPPDLTEQELAAAPVVASADALVIDDLSAEEYEAFVAALSS